MDKAVAVQATMMFGLALLAIVGVIGVAQFLDWLNDNYPVVSWVLVVAIAVGIVWSAIYFSLLGAK